MQRPRTTRPLAFKRAQRLVRGSDFERVYRRGARAKGETLIVVAAANELELSRLGLSVGKRIWKLAVRRNRLRRVFKEAFRLEQHRLPKGFDFVLIPALAGLVPELAATRAELVRLALLASQRYAARFGTSLRTSPPKS